MNRSFKLQYVQMINLSYYSYSFYKKKKRLFFKAVLGL